MNRRGAFILLLPLLAVSLGLGGPYLPLLRQPVCGLLGVVALDGLSPRCASIREARAAIARGQHDMYRRGFREALAHFRAATAAAPDYVPAQLARAQAAQILGEYAEALTA